MIKQQYIRIATFKPQEVLPFVVTDDTVLKLRQQHIKKSSEQWKKVVEKIYNGFSVKMNSQRYQLFATKGLTCVKCGITGSFFALERINSTRDNPLRFHFNLYAIDDNGEEVLITKDHIIPKSKGGKNTLNNYQVMCYNCNQEKGDGNE